MTPRALAGLALHEDALRYIELGAAGVLRREVVPLPSGCVSRALIQDFSGLETGFRDLRRRLGRALCPITLGLPSREATLKLLEYPPMPLSEVRGALALDFDRYFPYHWHEAVADIAEVELPDGEMGRRPLLAAAARRIVAESLLRMARRAAFSVRALEPMNVALLRAAAGRGGRKGAYLLVSNDDGIVDFVLGYRDNGVLFRSVPSDGGVEAVAQETRNTLAFARSQHRGLDISLLLLAGSLAGNTSLEGVLRAEGNEIQSLDVRTLWEFSPCEDLSRFETAVGLALRDAP